MDMTVVWLIAMIVLLAVEAVVPGLISIWFALGALAALVSALLHAPLWLQIVWCLVVSVAALALTRPLAKKYINSRTQPTNADMLIGKREFVLPESEREEASAGKRSYKKALKGFLIALAVNVSAAVIIAVLKAVL